MILTQGTVLEEFIVEVFLKLPPTFKITYHRITLQIMKLKRHSAESLIETLTAITVIVIATAAALSVVRTSLHGNNVISEKVVALNLALEGVEAVRNIRDTSYLRYSSDPDNCWNAIDPADANACATGDKFEAGETFYLTRDFEDDFYFEWHLVEASDTSITGDGWLDLYTIDLDGSSGSEEMTLYAQEGLDSSLGTPSAESVFQRLISVSSGPVTNSLNITSTVRWLDDGETREVSLTRTLANVY